MTRGGDIVTDTDNLLEMHLDGWTLAHCWLNAFHATGEDDDRPQLYRTIVVEWFDHGLQLVACDGQVLLGGFARSLDGSGPVPDHEELPKATYVAQDLDKRGRGLLKYLLGECRAAIKEDLPVPGITVTVCSAESPDAPTLSAELDRLDLVLETDRERVALPVYGGPSLDWRSFILDHNPSPTERIPIAVDALARLGRLSEVAAVAFVPDSNTGLVAIESADETYLFGAVSQAGGQRSR